MDGVEIVALKPVKRDKRGAIFQVENKVVEHFILVKRRKGTVSAGHCHTGKIKDRFPKLVLVADGRVEALFRNVRTGQELKKIFTKPVLLKIGPFVHHEVYALTDIVLIDINPTDYYKNDTVKSTD